jgi:hypothetical protein
MPHIRKAWRKKLFIVDVHPEGHEKNMTDNFYKKTIASPGQFHGMD